MMKDSIKRISEFNRFGSILGLERMKILLELLGNPEEKLKVIHVGGTNGKGSVSKYIYEILKSNGYKTGIYTSPFIENFRERIEFDGDYISEEELNVCTDEVLAASEKMVAQGKDSPTEFEILTAIAFLFFNKKKVDFLVLEVGLGGRGDSTNVIKSPLVSVITTISYDHMDRLGETIEEIAKDKAGIIKEGCPVVANVGIKEASKIIAREAYEKESRLYDVTKITPKITEKNLEWQKFNVDILGEKFDRVKISMLGEHQVSNAVTALTAIEILRKRSIIKLDKKRLYAGLLEAFQKGRFEIIKSNIIYVLDGAHNVEGITALVHTVKDLFPQKRILTILGILKDKDVSSMLDIISQVGSDFIATEPENSRKMPAKELRKLLEERANRVILAKNTEDALKIAASKKDNYDVVICAGSLYLIGEIRRFIKNVE